MAPAVALPYFRGAVIFGHSYSCIQTQTLVWYLSWESHYVSIGRSILHFTILRDDLRTPEAEIIMTEMQLMLKTSYLERN